MVNGLLNSSVTVAAIIFALVIGVVLSSLIISTAWVFYKPLMGGLTLAFCALILYFAIASNPASLTAAESAYEAEIAAGADALAGETFSSDYVVA